MITRTQTVHVQENLGDLTPILPFVDVSDGYAIQPGDSALQVTGAINSVVTLPVVGVPTGKTIAVSNGLSGGSNVTINAVGGPVIGNSGNGTSEVAWVIGDIRTFRWDGTMWWVIGR
jgi:hypothetical protein